MAPLAAGYTGLTETSPDIVTMPAPLPMIPKRASGRGPLVRAASPHDARNPGLAIRPEPATYIDM